MTEYHAVVLRLTKSFNLSAKNYSLYLKELIRIISEETSFDGLIFFVLQLQTGVEG